MSTIEKRLSVVLANADTDMFLSGKKFELSKSTTAKVLEESFEEDFDGPDQDQQITEMTMKGKKIEDAVTFTFSDSVETEVRTQFIGLNSDVSIQKKFLRSDGTVGLAPWTADADFK